MPKSGRSDIFSKFESSKQMLKIAQLREAGAYPFFPEFEFATELEPSELRLSGRAITNFGSNDYLGLTRDARVIAASNEATRRLGSASSGSRLLNGTSSLHTELERRLARFLGREEVMLVATGFQTNLALTSSVATRGELIISDEFCHASINEGIKLSLARNLKFKHNDIDSLSRVLENSEPTEGKLIAIEGVYSVTGDTSKLPEICGLAAEHGARVFLDDAHGIGVLGKSGRGTAEHFDKESSIDVVSGTFSKAFASSGGFVAGEAKLIQYLRHNAEAFVFSASMAPGTVAAALAALDDIESRPEKRETLASLSLYAREKIAQAGFDVAPGFTPAIIIRFEKKDEPLADAVHVGRFCLGLLDRGFYVNPIMGQAAPEPVVRVNIMATHSRSQIDALVEAMKKVSRGSFTTSSNV